MVDDLIAKAKAVHARTYSVLATGNHDGYEIVMRWERDEHDVLRQIVVTVFKYGYSAGSGGSYDDEAQAREVFEGLMAQYGLKVVE